MVLNDHQSSFKVASLGSGSKGNATLVAAGRTSLMIDCGFTLKETLSRCQRLGFAAEDLNAILVTHEHQDHIKGAGALSRKLKIPIYTSQGTYLSDKLGAVDFRRIKSYEDFVIGDLNIKPFSVPHDAREPCQFMFSAFGKRLGVLSDLGSITKPIIELLSNCQALMLEMNHDFEMLMNGPYPYQLKQRVAGNLGHLNNQQTLELLKKLDFEHLELMIATHLSEQNNCPQLVRKELDRLFLERQVQVKVAGQWDGFDWVDIIN